MPPTWLTVLSWTALTAAFASAAVILWDTYGRGHRQQMRVMEAVWPITALYFGPLAVWGYRRFGLPQSPRWREENGLERAPGKPGWATVSIGVSHCGAGCTIGDVVAATAVFWLGLSLFGQELFAEYLASFVLAVLLGLAFQYFAIAPMRGLGLREGIVAATKADILSLVAFEVGLFAWMALMRFVLFPEDPLRPDSAAYWFGMQVGMVIGFFTSVPANVWLIRRGIKEAM
ncbi:DUF4396 domain-containing protein [Kineococcus sp. SYSU DK005]|uniref:DUF4396 domain-containing protein n=1 Tax=Kineococcus sp. SYSU DK005 TaxID=3383126 RepID=UPI003D7CABA9